MGATFRWTTLVHAGYTLHLNSADEAAAVHRKAADLDAEADAQREALGIISRGKALYAQGLR